MRWLIFILPALFLAGCASHPTPKVVKVLPHFLDQQGRVAVSPSLYDRDAYQAQLRKQPAQRGGLRFDVQWRAAEPGPLSLRVDLRGVVSNRVTTAQLVTPLSEGGRFSRWSDLKLSGNPYHEFGEMTAWRVSLWQGEQMLAERRSFLW